jgi:capsular polysaccharide biosynthesis protein
MELKKCLTVISRYKIILVISIFVGALFGGIYYLLPNHFTATGLLYVRRSIDSSMFKYFSYEGFYAQQTAQSYTNTVFALLGSVNIRSAALKKMGIADTEANLFRYGMMIKSKKVGPQIINLTITGKTSKEAGDLWNAVGETITESVKSSNNLGGDPNLSVVKMGDSPVVRIQYKPLWACLPVGSVVLFTFTLLLISAREYFKWK